VRQLKIVAEEAVDEAERRLAFFDSGPAEQAKRLAEDLREHFISSHLRPGSSVVLTHVKPSGRELKLPGRLESFADGYLRLSRTFRSGGTYDTLDSPKQAGDHGQIEQLVGSWVSRRRYLRFDGSPIGELYNIQTPTELYPSGVRYLDLEVDVAVWPNGRVEVVDQRELEDAVRAGYVSEPLAQRALAIAEGVRTALAAGGTVRLEEGGLRRRPGRGESASAGKCRMLVFSATFHPGGLPCQEPTGFRRARSCCFRKNSWDTW
jgi:hypothetical protein